MVPVVVAHALPELTGTPQHWRILVRPRRRLSERLLAPLGRLPLRLVAVALLFTGVAEPIGQQDVGALIASGQTVPRWAQRLVASEGGSTHAPTFAYSGAAGPAVAAVTAGGGEKLSVAGFRPTEPGSPMALARVERAGKGERPITLAARTAPGEMASGSLMRTASFVAEVPRPDTPRVAFVKLAPVSEARARALFPDKPGDAESNDPAAIRARVLIAQAAAATSASLAAAYGAQSQMEIEAPFRALFADTTIDGGDDQVVTEEELAVDPHAWVGKPLPASVVTNSEQRCLAEAVYFEARGESYQGQVAVAQVVLNRVRNPAYPNTICGVVYQNRNWRNACQFSFACDLVPDRVTNASAWRQAQEIAREAAAGRKKIPELEAATHYHATYVRPRWARYMQKQKKVGLHVFYKTYGGGWS
jgi:spore germination cell wall hydrolase CwlJ-like protein